jgi:glycosyltransferase involved in cell wall biosynthesis
MRILLAAQTYDPPVNGPGVFSRQLAEGFVREGHQVLVLTPSPRLRAVGRLQNGVQVEGVPALPLLPPYSDVRVSLLSGPRVARLLDRFRPDVVHLQDHYPLCRSVLGAARRRDVPVLATNHFLPESMLPYIPLPGWCRPRIEGLLWKTALDVLNRADLVTAPSRTAAQILRERGLRVAVHVVSCGVDVERFVPDPGVDRRGVRYRYGLDPEATLFLYVGRLDREKRLEILLHALTRLDRRNLHLAMVGQGRHRAALLGLVERLGLARRVAFLGYVPGGDLPALLSSADVFAMPSDAELLSIATLEAMASGRPILAADAQALPELVQPGANGILFRPGDVESAARGIAALADHREDWARMGAASRARALPHDCRETRRRYLELYESLGHSVGGWPAESVSGPKRPRGPRGVSEGQAL